jgi:tetratricopeptide (TPR) repeat protein
MVVIRALIIAAVSVAVSAPIGSDQELGKALVAARDAVIEMAVHDDSSWNGAISIKVRELVDLLFVVDDRSSIAYLQQHLPQDYADEIRHVLEAASTPADFAARIAALDFSTEPHDDRDQALALIARQQSERSLLGDAISTAMRIAEPEKRAFSLRKIAIDCYRQNSNVEAERATSAIIDLALEPSTGPGHRSSMAQDLGAFASSLREVGKVEAARNVLAQMRFFVLSSATPRRADLEAFGHTALAFDELEMVSDVLRRSPDDPLEYLQKAFDVRRAELADPDNGRRFAMSIADPRDRSRALTGIARRQLADGDPNGAAETYQLARVAASEAEEYAAADMADIAVAQIDADDRDGARLTLEQALAASETPSCCGGQERDWSYLAAVFASLGDFTRAREVAARIGAERHYARQHAFRWIAYHETEAGDVLRVMNWAHGLKDPEERSSALLGLAHAIVDQTKK